MALYELRTYTLYVGKMAEATKLYQELGFPALLKTTPTGGSTGQGSSPTRTSWKALPPSFGRLS